jgi:hypothetical protein
MRKMVSLIIVKPHIQWPDNYAQKEINEAFATE